MKEDNTSSINKAFYDNQYSSVDVDAIIASIKNYETEFPNLVRYNTSWHGFYHGDFHKRLKGKKVLELGSGDCLNAGLMAMFGAEVYANDISSETENIVHKLNKSCDFPIPITPVNSSFLDHKFDESYFDFIVGKAFVHHLTPEDEIVFTDRINQLLKKDGEVRFFEPAVNSVILDNIRWAIPVPGRPSKFNKEAFAKWKENDPHPERDNSHRSYKRVGKMFFETVEVVPIGGIERLSRVYPAGSSRKKFRAMCFSIEKLIPRFIHTPIARSQLVIYKHAKRKD